MENCCTTHIQGILSLRPLLDFLDQIPADSDIARSCRTTDLSAMLKHAPELYDPITDDGVPEHCQELVNKLMALVFSPLMWETEIVGALFPFSMKPFYTSPLYERIFLDQSGNFRGQWRMGQDIFSRGRITRFYLFILEKLSGKLIHFDCPLICVAADPKTGLDRYFKIKFDARFSTMHMANGSISLTEKEQSLILKHYKEPETLIELLPPENFKVHGFTLMQALDVTESEVLHDLEMDMIEQESVISQSGFERVQHRLRTFFRRSDLLAGVAAIRDQQVLMLNTGGDMSHRCIFADSRHIHISEFNGSFLERAVVEDKIITVDDLSEDPISSAFNGKTDDPPMKSAIAAPLHYRSKCIGMLIIKTPRTADFDLQDIMLMNHIQPLFSMFIRRSLDDLDNRVQSIIKEKCTAIHPSVEWRFQQAAIQHLENLRMKQTSEIEPIVFKGVYPLFGVSDIRGSTNARNQAAQHDLCEHLDLAMDVVRHADQDKPMLIFRELAARINAHLERIQSGVNSGDELTVIQFLLKEVESVFPHLKSFGEETNQAISKYSEAIDSEVGTVYRMRKDFEESVSLLNSKLAEYVNQENSLIQAACPHYFERRRTDGVDYLIYIGKSMIENSSFNSLYLNNLRLWQIRVACGMAWHTERLKSSLKVPLDTAHLILVQNAPLSLRFRFDEKRFGVDGAYDTQHEIIKSRIDKAVVRGKNERLTQPENIAIVYSHPGEGAEMRRHIDFLRQESYLTGEPEALELDDLPGVHGLRALRVRVDLGSDVLAQNAGTIHYRFPDK